MSECERKGKLFGGCHFKAIFEERHSGKSFEFDHFKGTSEAMKAIRSLFVVDAFVGSMCTRCGKKGEA